MLVDEIAARLVSQSVGIAPASTGTASQWVICKVFEPDAPDRTVTVTPTGGPLSWVNATVRRPTFQVRVRGPAMGGSTLLDRCEKVVAALDKVNGTFSGTTFVDCRQQGDTIFLGYDDNNRPLAAMNFATIRANT